MEDPLYPVESVHAADEFSRLALQDRLLNDLFPLFPPGVDAHKIVLDVACGTGGWLRRVKRACPDTSCIGLDENELLLDHARNLAENNNLEIYYKQGNMLELARVFKNKRFDFIQMRAASWFLGDKRQEVFAACRDLLFSSGAFSVIDFIQPTQTNSAAFQQWSAYFLDALKMRGTTYANVQEFPDVLNELGFVNVSQHFYRLDLSVGVERREGYVADVRDVFTVFKPMVLQLISEEKYDDLAQQCLHDLDTEGFSMVMNALMVVGQKP